MSSPGPYKPSSLSFNSPSRASPFRRPNSPLPPSPSTIRAREGSPSPTKFGGSLSPEKNPQSPLRNSIGAGSGARPEWLTTRGNLNSVANRDREDGAGSPTKGFRSSASSFSNSLSRFENGSLERSATQHTAPAPTAETISDDSSEFETSTLKPSDPSLAAYRSAGTPTPPANRDENKDPFTENARPLPEPVPAVATRDFASSLNGGRNSSNSFLRNSGPAINRTPTPETTSLRPSPLRAPSHNDPISKVPPQLLHSMRESFSVLDSHNSGNVTAPDVVEALSSLGLDSNPATLNSYFKHGNSMNLATYLNTLANLLGPMSSEKELLAAFEAFDDDDSGQIDIQALSESLMHTPLDYGEQRLSEREIGRVVEGFSGRRALSKRTLGNGKGGGRSGDVFRYGEFVQSINGAGATAEGQQGAVA